MKPRILLINPWIHDFAAFNLWACPLGLLTVAEYLSSFDADLFYLDCTDSFDKNRYGAGKYRSEITAKPDLLKSVPRHYKRYGISREEFKAKLDPCRPIDLVLVTSIMSYWYPGVQEAVELVRNNLGRVPIILGGIYPTLYPDHASRCSGADRIYSGPVQDRLLCLLRSLGITLAPVRKPISRHILDFAPDHGFSPLLTSTGCPFQCTYCASKLLSCEYRKRPIDDILKELDLLSERGVRDVAFYDDALLYDADRHIKPLLKTMNQRGPAFRFHAPNGLHARFLDDELAVLMKTADFRTIRLSFETVNRVRQEQTGGKVFTDDLVRAIRSLQKQGFTREHIGVYLLYGLPGQGLDEVEEGVAFLQQFDVSVLLAEFSPIRGTACWDDLVKQSIIPDDLDPILTNNTVFSFLYSGYDKARVERIKLRVKEYNRM